jgi:hypothetical protein
MIPIKPTIGHYNGQISVPNGVGRTSTHLGVDWNLELVWICSIEPVQRQRSKQLTQDKPTIHRGWSAMIIVELNHGRACDDLQCVCVNEESTQLSRCYF